MKGDSSTVGEIRFFYDEMEREINVIHVLTGKHKKIKRQKKIEQFLKLHGVTLEDCKKVRRDFDRMGLFKKRLFLFK